MTDEKTPLPGKKSGLIGFFVGRDYTSQNSHFYAARAFSRPAEKETIIARKKAPVENLLNPGRAVIGRKLTFYFTKNRGKGFTSSG
jgi:hypothetical protein